MEIQRCLEILELSKDSSSEEVRQAYKDLVNIWHPDRIGNNPRLKKKAEEKLKDINIAYEELSSFLSSRPKAPHTVQKTSPTVQKKPREQPQTEVFHAADRAKTEIKKAPKPNVDIQPIADFFSSLWKFLSKALEALNAAQGPSNEPMRTRTSFGPTGGQRQDRSRGMGRGRGMGGGGRGRGRRR